MRTLILDKASDAKQFLADAGRGGRSIEALQKLNPHVDLRKITGGTVLFVPDSPDDDKDGSRSLGGEPFSAFEALVAKSLAEAAGNVRAGYAARAQQQKDVLAAIKSAGTKRVIESDPELKAALEAAAKQDKADQLKARETEKLLEAVGKQLAADLGAIGRLLG